MKFSHKTIRLQFYCCIFWQYTSEFKTRIQNYRWGWPSTDTFLSIKFGESLLHLEMAYCIAKNDSGLSVNARNNENRIAYYLVSYSILSLDTTAIVCVSYPCFSSVYHFCTVLLKKEIVQKIPCAFLGHVWLSVVLNIASFQLMS